MEFEPHQRDPAVPLSKNFTLIAKYWSVPGTDSSIEPEHIDGHMVYRHDVLCKTIYLVK